MQFRDFVKRDDLCHKGQSRCLYKNETGAIIKIKHGGWYATVDIRRELVGIKSNNEMVQPTVGPFNSAREAYEAFKQARPNWKLLSKEVDPKMRA